LFHGFPQPAASLIVRATLAGSRETGKHASRFKPRPGIQKIPNGLKKQSFNQTRER
jgi:hypothetical protein